METSYRIAVLPGDGIGNEVMAAAGAVLEALEGRMGRHWFWIISLQAFSRRNLCDPWSSAARTGQPTSPAQSSTRSRAPDTRGARPPFHNLTGDIT